MQTFCRGLHPFYFPDHASADAPGGKQRYRGNQRVICNHSDSTRQRTDFRSGGAVPFHQFQHSGYLRSVNGRMLHAGSSSRRRGHNFRASDSGSAGIHAGGNLLRLCDGSSADKIRRSEYPCRDYCEYGAVYDQSDGNGNEDQPQCGRNQHNL